MTQPEALKGTTPLKWSPGTGRDVWEMLCACAAGNLDAVRRLVSREPSLVRCHYVYRTPLHFAVRENRIDVARFLLDRDASPLAFGTPDTLLQMARDRGHGEMERLLEIALAGPHRRVAEGEALASAIRGRDAASVRQSIDGSPDLVHAVDERTNQPIHWAVMTRQVDIVDDLIARGADIEAKRLDGARPIHLTNGDYHYRGWRDVPDGAASTPDEVYRHLVTRGASVDIGMAAAKGDVKRVRDLLDDDRAVANRAVEYGSYYPGSGTPLRNAASAGHLEIVTLLLAHGADPNLPEDGIAPNGHALYSAVAGGHHEIVTLLFEHGAHPNPEVESSGDALSRALARGDRRTVDLLCSYGASRSVHLLAYDGDVQTAAAVFDVNPALADDPTALANAASNGHEAFVRLMLRFQPDLAARIDIDGSWAVGPKTRELTELLFSRGMRPDQRDWLEATPLHHFAARGDIERASLYLDHGAPLHARDEELCSTPLAWAARAGHLPMVQFLLARGAMPNLPDDPPWATPLAWARRRGHADVTALLQQ